MVTYKTLKLSSIDAPRNYSSPSEYRLQVFLIQFFSNCNKSFNMGDSNEHWLKFEDELLNGSCQAKIIMDRNLGQ